jgi:hypothetical protein
VKLSYSTRLSILIVTAPLVAAGALRILEVTVGLPRERAFSYSICFLLGAGVARFYSWVFLQAFDDRP